MKSKLYDLQKAVDLSNSHGIKPFNNLVDENILFHTRPYKNEPQIYAKKIRFFPTTKQKQFFRKAFGVSRLYYNESIDLFNTNSRRTFRIMNSLAKQGCIHQNNEGKQCKKDLDESKWFCKKHKSFKVKNGISQTAISYRKELVKKDHPEWRNIIPHDSKDRVIRNAIGSIKAAQSNRKNGNIEHFKMGFRSKHDLTQILYFDSRALQPGAKLCSRLMKKHDISPYLEIRCKKDKRWLAKQFEIGIQITKERSKRKYEQALKKFNEGKGKEPVKRTTKYSQQLPSDFTIKYVYPDRYYLCVVSERKPLNIKAPYNVVGLDPGVRTFQTYYSSKDVYGKIGEGIKDKIDKIGKRVDTINSYVSKEENIGKMNRMRKRCFKLRTKAKNIVSELHNQTALFLCKNFENILLPKFETQKMSKKDDRKINNKTVRCMMSLRHYQFYLKLLSKADHYNRNVFHCNEAYTSKTCGGCGKIDDKLGSKKIFSCNCGFEMDRDVNGARNVLLRHIGFAIALE